MAVYEQRQWKEAAAAFRTAIDLQPGNPDAHNNLGNALLEDGKVAEAGAAFRAAIRARPNYPWAHKNLAAVLRRQGRVEEAVAACRVAIYLKPDYYEAFINLGAILAGQQKMAEAAAAFEQATRANPNDYLGHNNLGRALVELGQLESAAASFEKAVERNPQYAPAYHDLGAALARLGRWDTAAAAYDRAAELAPDGPGRYLAAALHLAAGDADGYRRACRELLRRHNSATKPEVAGLVARTCCLAPDAGVDRGRVEQLAERAVADEQPAAYRPGVLARGLAAHRAARPAEAVKWLGRFRPDAGGGHRDAAAFAALALAHRAEGRPADAALALAKARAILKEKSPDPAAGRPFGRDDWVEWAHARILVREAETGAKD